ncbi:hypothetical protein CKAN_01647800 [Cinnamomum micranthum f. kanehirae]|uniref:Uncharacterized protein n=1 Tax=Cinnamomum micranthum f. kanehirae TaxID=337451 RepID=A0A3S3PC23_9MAGN|nr:hypothetical protein CKAN_01647800 [Cinnamomum micranthum f. kanehirae]
MASEPQNPCLLSSQSHSYSLQCLTYGPIFKFRLGAKLCVIVVSSPRSRQRDPSLVGPRRHLSRTGPSLRPRYRSPTASPTSVFSPHGRSGECFGSMFAVSFDEQLTPTRTTGCAEGGARAVARCMGRREGGGGGGADVFLRRGCYNGIGVGGSRWMGREEDCWTEFREVTQKVVGADRDGERVRIFSRWWAV